MHSPAATPREPVDAPAAPPADRELAWRRAGALLVAAVAALMLATFLHYGETWDEEFERAYGESVLRWYTSAFQDRAALADWAHGSGETSHYYGASFGLLAQAAVRVSPLGPYETRHLVNVLVALAGLVATWRLGTLLGGGRSGLFAALLLATTPAWYGHAFNDPKDIPFATLHAWVLVLALELATSLPKARWTRVVGLGVVAGLALGVRVGGAFVLGYVALAWGATLLLSPGPAEGRRKAALAAAARLAVATAVAWGVLLLSWPGALASPVARPLRALAEMGRTGTVMPVLFDGASFLSADLPRSYLPTWLAISLPETWFIALAAAAGVAALSLRRRAGVAPGSRDRVRAIRLAVLATSGAFPIAVAVVTRPNMFDAWRHFLFVAPPLAAVAGDGLSRFALDAPVPRALRLAVGGAAATALSVVVADMVALHPYEADYFNRSVAGGLPGAAGRFETDYWGESYREGIEWLVSQAPPGEPVRPLRVANCSTPFLTGYPLSQSARTSAFVSVAVEDRPDIVLATTRHDCARDLRADGWRVLHEIDRMGVPLGYVLAAPGR